MKIQKSNINNMYFNNLLIYIFSLFYFLSCENSPDKDFQDYVIQWDKSTLVCIADEGGYPRVHQISDGTLMAAYENRRGDVVVKKSSDGGRTWSEATLVYDCFTHVNKGNGLSCNVHIANPEFISLPNGDILLATNLRPDKPEIFPFSIAVKRSKDKGATWSESQIVYSAAPRFSDGCWEPSFLRLSDGTLQLYFANENPYRTSDEQEISMLTSKDNGATWSETAIMVSFRKSHRDGMPVPVTNGDEIFVAIEDNVSGQFKPYIVRNNIANNWSQAVLANSPNRWSALKTPLPDLVYAGAPYLITTDGGLFVLSYQTTGGRTSNWELSTMEVVISETADNFRNPTRPFNVPLLKEAKWNSLVDLGNGIVAAVSSTNFNSDKIGIWMIKGRISKQ